MDLIGIRNNSNKILSKVKIATYFKEGMKPFLNSPRYLRTNQDGSVEFKLSYTQAIEILPFIKNWLPDIKIISPSSLIDVLVKDLNNALDNYVS